MKVTYNWLKDYVDIKDSPEELAHLLTMAGLEVTSLEKKGNDFILETEVTPNRPDWLSVIGVAREVAAITGKKLKTPKSIIQGLQSKDPRISIEIKDKKLCPRYSGRVIEGVKVASSPEWIEGRLKSLNLRPVNNIADITNFCLLETGQPMHAFDYDKIKGARIVVRCAKKDEEITTIDNVKRKLSPDTLIIADEEKPIAIAGVMGGLNTEVGPGTKNILLESAYFNPISVRRTSRKLGLISESSYRFERGVDVESIVEASNRATVLIKKIAEGSAKPLVDKGAKKAKPKTISYDIEKTNSLLGVKIPGSKAKSIFNSLGFKVTGSSNKLKVKIPCFRRDLNSEVDLIEEAARIYGYEKIPATIPEMVSQPRRKDTSRIIQENIRQMLIASGLTEVVTYSLISKKALKKFSPEEKDTIAVVNPLSAEQEVMRPTILIGMLGAILWNLNRKVSSLKFFELGNVYYKNKNNFDEKLSLVITLTGNFIDTWRQKRKADFFSIKGIIEAVLCRLGVRDISFEKENVPYLLRSESASLKVNGEKIGVAGKITPKLLSRFDIDEDVYTAELRIDKLLSSMKLKKSFKPIPKFPSVKRDISVLLDSAVPASRIISAIKETGISSIAKIEVFDEYHGKQIPKGKKSLSFSILYQDRNKTLTDAEVDQVHSKVKEALTQKFSAQFR